MLRKDFGFADVLFCWVKKIIKKVFFIQKNITFDLSKALKQSNKPLSK